MKYITTLTAVAACAATLMSSASAEATVAEPDGVWAMAASPGIATGVAALVTTAGAAASVGEDPTQTGWVATAIVFGSLSVISGGVYGGFAADTKSDSVHRVFIPTSISNITMGLSSIALGIAAATVEATPEERPWVPHVAVSDEGGTVSFSGAF